MTFIPEFDKKDKMGRPLTISLFYETNNSEMIPVFTLKDDDHVHLNSGILYYSLRKVYMEIADPTEYSFAQAVFGSWKHWLKIVASPILAPHIQEWREELEIKLRSEALRAMMATARDEGAKGTTAAKYIAEKGWESKAGRPSKEEITRTKKIHAGIRDEIDEDAKNIGLLQ